MHPFYERLYRQNERVMKFGLDAIRTALSTEDALVTYPHCLVAGTNGKGQVSALMSNACTLLGMRTGLFTSPHLVEFRERIRVDGRLLDDAEIIRIGSEVLARFGGDPVPEFTGTALTYFECCLMMALRAFKAHSVQFGVFEVGLGGRLDATNALAPGLSVITSIGRDHEAYLGHEISQIAHEKAGIMRAGCPVVCGRTACEFLSEEARRHECSSMDALGRDFDWKWGDTGIVLESKYGRIPMTGAEKMADFQRDNAAVAYFALLRAHEIGLIGGDIRAVLGQIIERTKWVGRLWHCPGSASRLGVADIVLDGAHNPDGVRALMAAVRQNPAQDKALVVNSCADKDIGSMFPQYLEGFDNRRIFVVPVKTTARACSPQEYCRRTGLADAQVCVSLEQGIERACAAVGKQGTVYVSGSLYLIGETVTLLGEQDSLSSILV